MYSRSHKRGIIRHSLKNCQENYYLVLALSGTRVTASQFITGLPQRCDQYSNKCEQSDAQRESVHSSKQNLWTITYGFQHLLSSISSYHLHLCQESMWAEKIFVVSQSEKCIFPLKRPISAIMENMCCGGGVMVFVILYPFLSWRNSISLFGRGNYYYIFGLFDEQNKEHFIPPLVKGWWHYPSYADWSLLCV